MEKPSTNIKISLSIVTVLFAGLIITSVVKFIPPVVKVAGTKPKVTVVTSSKVSYLQDTKAFFNKNVKKLERKVNDITKK